jgi:hypothetical protein
MKIILSEEKHREILSELFDYNTFDLKKKLCPYIFHINTKMFAEVSSNITSIAINFFKFLNLDWVNDVEILDIQLVGSLAGYNWSELYSSLEIHILIDFNKISSSKDLLESDFWSSKEAYKEKHNLSIKGFPIDLQIQDINDNTFSDGVYSVKRGRWLKHPIKREILLNKRKINGIVSKIAREIQDAISKYRENKFDISEDMSNDIKDDIIALQKLGKKNGQMSSEFFAYNLINRGGLLSKVSNLEKNLFDKKNSSELNAEDKIAKNDFINRKKEKVNINDIGKPKQVKGDGDYKISGKYYKTLRQAAEDLGLTIGQLNYRVNSKSAKYGSYKKV